MDMGGPILKCDWVKSNNEIKVDKLGFTYVNLSKMGHKDDPFILVSQRNQVFYVDNSMESGWFIEILVEPINISPDNDEYEVETLEQLNTTTKELI